MSIPGFFAQFSTKRYNYKQLKFIDQHKETNLVVPAVNWNCIDRCNKALWACDDVWADCSRDHYNCVNRCM